MVAEVGCAEWYTACLLHDFAQANAAACARVAAATDNPALAAAVLEEATAWWLGDVGFAPVQAAMAELEGCPVPWAISSGWAIDLFLGRSTRVHHDIDLVVDRNDQFAIRAHLEARGYRFLTPLEGQLEPWPPHMRLELPRHQVHAHRENDFLDILLTDFTGGFWQYRREPSILRAQARAIRQSAAGVPYLAPELVLLFKSKNTGGRPRPQDQHDFDVVAPELDAEARTWLCWAITASEPGHPWLSRLRAVP